MSGFCQNEKDIPSSGENFPKAWRQGRISWSPKTAGNFPWLGHKATKASAWERIHGTQAEARLGRS